MGRHAGDHFGSKEILMILHSDKSGNKKSKNIKKKCERW